jgi:hypothetical protein
LWPSKIGTGPGDVIKWLRGGDIRDATLYSIWASRA